MSPLWMTAVLKLLKELLLLVLLAGVLITMIGGVLIIAILNLPENILESRGVYVYIGVFMIVFAPILALARVIEWWVNLYRRFSDIFLDEGPS